MKTHLTSPPAHAVYEVQASDGSTLTVRDWGEPGQPPVVFHHGLPAGGLKVPGGWEALDELPCRVITFDRPGFSGTPPRSGRSVSSAAAWSEAIADALSLDRFAVMGTSGGGPHAAAAAALLPGRVSRLCISVGVGPADVAGFDIRDHVMLQTRDEIDLARAGEPALRHYVDKALTQVAPLEPWLSQIAEPDVEVLSRAELRFEEQAAGPDWLTQSPEGWIDDDLALFARPWGFDFAAIVAPTVLLYGRQDVLVSPAHGEAYQRAIPHADLFVLDGAGHWMRDYEPEALRWLTADTLGTPDFVL